MSFGLVKLNFSDFLKFSVSSTREHAYKLYKYRCKIVRAHFFCLQSGACMEQSSLLFSLLSAFKRSNRTVKFIEDTVHQVLQKI